MNTILAIETSTAACSVALYHNGEITEVFELLPQKHAQRILAMVDEVLAKAQVKPDQLDLLGFGRGPGAFTGVRIATGVVQGLALGWDKPVIGVSSLEALALAALEQKQEDRPDGRSKWVALLDARMNEVYCQTGEYESNTLSWQAEAPMLLSEQAVIRHLEQDNLFSSGEAFGDIEQAFPGLAGRFKSWQASQPRAGAVARLLDIKVRQNDVSAFKLEESIPLPLYLRNEVAETIEQRRKKRG